MAALLSLGAFSVSSNAQADEVAPVNSYATPAFKVGGQVGLGYYTEHGPFGTNTAIAQGLALGYSLGLRASVEIFDWLAFDARGTLAHNQGGPLAGGGNMTTLGGWGAARLTWPLEHVQPYALLGFGGFHHAASGADTSLVSGTVPAAVMGLGAMVPVGHGFDVGVEYVYSFLIGETLSTNENIDGGDPSSVSLFLQYRVAP